MKKHGFVMMNVSTNSEAVLTPENLIHGKLIFVMPNGQEVELSVNEVLEMDLQAYDPITGYQIENADLTL